MVTVVEQSNVQAALGRLGIAPAAAALNEGRAFESPPARGDGDVLPLDATRGRRRPPLLLLRDPIPPQHRLDQRPQGVHLPLREQAEFEAEERESLERAVEVRPQSETFDPPARHGAVQYPVHPKETSEYLPAQDGESRVDALAGAIDAALFVFVEGEMTTMMIRVVPSSVHHATLDPQQRLRGVYRRGYQRGRRPAASASASLEIIHRAGRIPLAGTEAPQMHPRRHIGDDDVPRRRDVPVEIDEMDRHPARQEFVPRQRDARQGVVEAAETIVSVPQSKADGGKVSSGGE
mmetsp:Transcript_49449/g.149014  ORF Transcript_49449/g.149014 Transcript_49449/m.149014 type:complete len:292 (-) Transcript_49449:253-1128(-)